MRCGWANGKRSTDKIVSELTTHPKEKQRDLLLVRQVYEKSNSKIVGEIITTIQMAWKNWLSCIETWETFLIWNLRVIQLEQNTKASGRYQ